MIHFCSLCHANNVFTYLQLFRPHDDNSRLQAEVTLAHINIYIAAIFGCSSMWRRHTWHTKLSRVKVRVSALSQSLPEPTSRPLSDSERVRSKCAHDKLIPISLGFTLHSVFPAAFHQIGQPSNEIPQLHVSDPRRLELNTAINQSALVSVMSSARCL